ncbi:MAG: S1C family serine protease [Anaerolineae bacterium]
MNRRSRIWVVVVLLVGLSLGCLALPPLSEDIEPTPTPLAPAPTVEAGPVVVAPPDNALENLQTQVEAVYAATGESVVNISVRTISYDFFMNPVPQEGSGSGFVYDNEGNIITNFHVIEGADDIRATFADGTTLAAEVVGSDPTYDLAVIKVDPTKHPLRPVTMGDSQNLRIGQFVVAIGNPFGLDQTLTFGVISSLGRIIQSPDQGRFIGEAIQTDAAINPGNSGGPLLDLEGRVIGVNAQIVSPSRANAGIGFAIPAQIVKRVVPVLISEGEYAHPWMGVEFLPLGLEPGLAEVFAEAGYKVPSQGVLIISVEEGMAADRAGLQGAEAVVQTELGRVPLGGDVILEIDGTEIPGPQDLIAYLETYTQPGDTIEVTIFRDGETMTVDLTLGERP